MAVCKHGQYPNTCAECAREGDLAEIATLRAEVERLKAELATAESAVANLRAYGKTTARVEREREEALQERDSLRALLKSLSNVSTGQLKLVPLECIQVTIPVAFWEELCASALGAAR